MKETTEDQRWLHYEKWRADHLEELVEAVEQPELNPYELGAKAAEAAIMKHKDELVIRSGKPSLTE